MPNPSGVPVDDDDDDSSLSALDSREEIASVNYVDEQTKPAAPKTEEKKEAVKESEPPKAPPKKSPSNVPPAKVPTKAPKKPPPMPETEYSEVPDKVNNEIDDAKAKIEADKKNVISLKKEITPHVKKTLKVGDLQVILTTRTQILLTSLAPSPHY